MDLDIQLGVRRDSLHERIHVRFAAEKLTQDVPCGGPAGAPASIDLPVLRNLPDLVDEFDIRYGRRWRGYAADDDFLDVAQVTADQVRVWSLRLPEPHPYIRLSGHRGTIFTLAFDPTGHRLASGGDDKSVRVWDLDRVRDELKALGLDE